MATCTVRRRGRMARAAQAVACLLSALVLATCDLTGLTAKIQNDVAVGTAVKAGLPFIAISASSASFYATPGGADPAPQNLRIGNEGAGSLGSLSTSVSYSSGAADWLVAALDTTASPATLTLSPTTGSLPSGKYSAMVALSSNAANGAISISVSLVVADAPGIGLSGTSLSFAAQVGSASPPSQKITVSNLGVGSLTGLGETTSYVKGSGWLSVAFDNGTTTAPATLTVQAQTGSLAAGVYTATVSVSAPGAGNSPQKIGVTFTVSTTPIVPVTGVSLNTDYMGKSMTVLATGQYQLTATVAPVDATDNGVSWSSNDKTIAAVSDSGLVTGVRAGNATITVTTHDGGFSDQCAVTVSSSEVRVTGLTLNVTSTSMHVGDTLQLTPTVSPSNATNQTVAWSTSASAEATVSASGLVTAVAAGSATITASTADGGKTATCAVTVSQPVTGLALDQTSLSLSVGGSAKTLTATVSPSNATNKAVNWSSDNAGVAAVTASGVVAPKSAGTATITATTVDGGHAATCAVTVTQPVTGVSVSPMSLSLYVGVGTGSLTATVSPANATNQAITWTSGNANVATVSAAGVVSPVSPGTAAITATTVDGGKTATCSVTVTRLVTGVSLNSSSMSLSVGGSAGSLTATISPPSATNQSVNWTSSNTSVATVSASGTVTPVSPGAATVKVTTVDGGYSASCLVTVTRPVTGVSLNVASLSLSVGGSSGSLTATVSPSNATNQAVSWASNNASVATVTGSGVVTPSAPGTATITATTADGGFAATCAVTVTQSVTGISLAPTSLGLYAGGNTGSLTATITPSNASNKTLAWISSNTGVATVNSFGVVTPVSVGTATITATTADGGRTATCAVTVSPIAVTGVALDSSTLALSVGSTRTLTATVSPSNATNKAVTWTSGSPGVATVGSATGLVTAVGAGTATITATTADGSHTATCAVTVTQGVTSVSVNLSTLQLDVGGSGATVTASVSPANATNKTVTWSSSNTGVATVSSSGLVTPISSGTAAITATTSDGGFTAACAVTVVQLVTGVSLNYGTAVVLVGSSFQLTASISPANATNQKVDWFSGDKSVATVTASGLVTGVKAGNATITVFTEDGSYSDQCAVTVATAAIPVSGVSLNESSASIYVGDTLQLTPAVSPTNATNQTVTWSTSDASKASVSSSGLVTGLAAGSAAITATTADGGKTATCSLTISAVSVTGVSLSSTSLSLNVGATGSLSATVSPANATNKAVTWSSGSSSVATVGLTTGVVTAVAPGTATITATTGDGSHTASCVVTVTQPVAGVGLSQTSLALSVGGSASSLVATIYPANSSNKAVTWSSSAASVATVSSSGTVSPVSTGTATITATTADGGYTATCAVTVTQSVTGVSLSPTSLSLYVGGSSGGLTATVAPVNATNKAISWSSDTTSVATVSASGVVTPVSAGTAKVTVTTADGGKTATCAVTVIQSVIGVSLSASSLSLKVGGSPGNLTATVSPSTATNKAVAWTSGNSSVATVNSSGAVSPVAPGTATITATTADGSYTANCVVTVTQSVSGLSLDKSNAIVYIGEANISLTATISPANATNQAVTWTSSATDVATVNSSGVVLAMSPGTTTITATTADGGYAANCSLTVKQHVSSISLNPTYVPLSVGGPSFTLGATILPLNATNQSITWSSSATSVATVSSGVVTPVAAGSAIITATTADGGYSSTCTVAVTLPVTGVSLSPKSVQLSVGGETVGLTATVLPANATNKAVTWSSQAPNIATVDSSGVVTPVASGLVNIYATTVDGNFRDQCSVQVEAVVSYSGNGASSGSPPLIQEFMVGQQVTVFGNIGNCALSGYNLIGWNTASNGSGTFYSPGSTFTMPIGNVVLYAVWSKEVAGSTTIDTPPYYQVAIQGATILHYGTLYLFASSYTGSPGSASNAYSWYLDTSTTPIGNSSALSFTPTVATYTYGVHVLTLIIQDVNGLSYAGSLVINVQN